MFKKITQLIASDYSIKQSIRNETTSLILESKCMSEIEFWTNVKVLANNINKYGKEHGVHNFFCDRKFTSVQTVEFVKTYREKMSLSHRDCVYKAIASNEGYFRSDDGWYDFCDRLPLEGAEVYHAVLAGTLDKNHPVRQNHQELYVCTALQDAMLPWLKTDNSDDEEEYEVSALDYVKQELYEANKEIRVLKEKLAKVQNALK